MTVLVCYAGKMGGTQGIADAIGDQLRTHGLAAVVADAATAYDPSSYQAVVLGSAIYMGKWRSEAVAALSRLAKQRSDRPIWLFQSGPFTSTIDQSTTPTPKKVLGLAKTCGAARPMTFGGRIEPGTAKGFLAKRMAVGANAGDHRDFVAIRRWADSIALATLAAAAPPV